MLERHDDEFGDDDADYGYDDGSVPKEEVVSTGPGAHGGKPHHVNAMEHSGFRGASNQASNIANYDYGVGDEDSDEEHRRKWHGH